jgi:hypothetical protein
VWFVSYTPYAWMTIHHAKLYLIIFIVVPCIFNNVRILLPTNTLFIRHIKC